MKPERTNRPRFAPAAWTVLALAMLASGCASYQGIEPQSTLRTPESLGLGKAAGTVASGLAAEAAPVNAEWWHAFGDAGLDRLIAQALKDSPSLKVAQARIARARAAVEAAHAAELPQVSGELDLQRQRYTENGLFPPPIAGSMRNSATLQANGSWELDFFGKHRQALDAALGTTRAAEADADAARVLLASNIARAYIQLARLHDQLQVAERTLAQRQASHGLVRDRFNAGLDTALELRQSEGSLPEARQQIEAVAEQIELTRHAIAALVADPQAAVEAKPLAALKPVPVAGPLPADLLGRRADVAAARWRVEAATHDIRSAKADFYPNINIAGFIGLSSLGVGKLLEPGSLQWGVGPAIHLPIFDAGRLRAGLRGKTADLDIAIETYNSTVIDAVKDAADQLASLRSIARQQKEEADALSSAEAAYDIALQRYRAGLGTYLNVLTAESSVLQQRRLSVDLAGRALDAQVQLMRALGGGWQPDARTAQLESNESSKKEQP
ncbi:MAG TPA: efflux transporter outer membrane subunit [Ramlibacter sp.]|uniref:efflux transporter outer membrane subunit n=1 Tax=Ramlibacter sp. TaxID=1917967 RepID=UPI002BEB0BF1|nr:efflux transporter outer membrane subunit [Ramlibacter sp.]HVZ42911.1 efflux transporter outer membrane subunit [Ramlibacter sp.]